MLDQTKKRVLSIEHFSQNQSSMDTKPVGKELHMSLIKSEANHSTKHQAVFTTSEVEENAEESYLQSFFKDLERKESGVFSSFVRQFP